MYAGVFEPTVGSIVFMLRGSGNWERAEVVEVQPPP
eukprot:gene3590-7446_t